MFEPLKPLESYVFLRTDSKLSFLERSSLVEIAVLVNHFWEKEVVSRSYFGTIKTNGKMVVLGCFYGKEFKAEIETKYWKSQLSFLVLEKMDQRFN